MSYAKMFVRHRKGLFLAKGHNISPRLFIYNNRQCSENSKKYWHIVDRKTGQVISRYPYDKHKTKAAAISAAPSELKYLLDTIENNDSFAQQYDLAVLEYNLLLDEYKSGRKEM